MNKKKQTKIISILKRYNDKISQIESKKQKLLADIQTDQDQDKLSAVQDQLKNL